MELLDRDLHSLCDGKLSVQKCGDFLLHITSGLQFMHGLRMLHLDVKPANVLLTSGVAKLGDFGISANKFPRRNTNVQGGTGGTPHYLPWDTWHNQTYAGERNDIWGAGCCL
eukprot:Skav203479  [mRNA]  locus=scaffold921:288065:288400:+ [translate_table: standard]